MSEIKELYVLLAAAGQLSGNGQLRETIKERRNRRGDDVPIWYLSPELVQKFELSEMGFEAVVAQDLTAINWLRLRFGGETSRVELDIQQLREHATILPPEPINRDISS